MAGIEENVDAVYLPLSSTVQKWGNSLAVRLPKEVLMDLNIEQGTKLNFKKLPDGNLAIVPVRKERKKYKLDDLLAQCKIENRGEEVDFGMKGNELI